MAKSNASSRTVDMFSGLTRQQVEAEQKALAEEDAVEAHKQAESIEQAAERWRANAFFTQEHLSKHFNDGEPGTAVYRLTEKDGWQFLEQFRLGKDGKAYGWTGLMFKDSDLYEITNVFVKASKAKKAREDGTG